MFKNNLESSLFLGASKMQQRIRHKCNVVTFLVRKVAASQILEVINLAQNCVTQHTSINESRLMVVAK